MHEKGFRDRLTFWWSNHFVTILEAYACPSYLYQYHKILKEDCLGNLQFSTDFRSIYATILEQWLCLPSENVDAILGAWFARIDTLGLECVNF